MYYLKHEHECFIRYKTRGAAERFISDKARIDLMHNDVILWSRRRKSFENGNS